MVSSTESSDWNVSPTSRPAPNFPPQLEPTSIILPESILNDEHSPAANRSSSSSTPRLGSFSTSKNAPGGTKSLNQRVSGDDQSGPTETKESTFVETPIVPSNDISTSGDGALDSPSFDPASQNVQISSSSKARRGGAKTVRRGKGGGNSRSRIKPEPNVETLNLADVPPARVVNRGGRPRGSRAGASSGRTINRGGRPRGSRAGASASSSRRPTKRKRRMNKSDDEDDDDGGDTSGSEAINLPSLSSSGRRITQANTFTPPVINLDAPSSSTAKKPRTAARIVDAAPVFLTGAMKRKLARNPAEAAVCRNCGRGHSPNSNQIVFCDGCNTPWHQFCHDRPITPTVIQIEESEWHCADCEIEQSLKDVGSGRVTAERLAQSSGIHRTLKWKRDYLSQLPKELLVSLLLHAHVAHEEMPLFEEDSKAGFVATAAVVMYADKAGTTTQSKETELQTGERKGPNLERQKGEVGYEAPDEDEGYYEEPLPYPKMGNGLVLPPEEDDLGILVDEDETLYSHSWQGGTGSSWLGLGVNGNRAVNGTCNNCNKRDRIDLTSTLCLRCDDPDTGGGRQSYAPDSLASR